MVDEVKTHECPKCGSTRVLRISYGLPLPPNPDDPPRTDFIEGGCIISDDSPTQGCLDCGEQWGQRRPSEPFPFNTTLPPVLPPTP